MKHIAVIGAGITGVTTCYSLLKRGYNVTVIDRHRYPAMATSFANGGQLSASNAEVWTQTSTILKGIKWMLKKDAPLLVNPRPDWHKLSWMAQFVGNIRNYESNTVETTRLAIAARQHLLQWADQEGIEFDYEQRGILHIYANKKEYDHATRVNKMLHNGGLSRRAVSADEIREIEPALQTPLYGGYYTDSDSTGDIHKYTRGLADACVRLGARFMCDTSVQDISLNDNGATVSYHHQAPGAAANNDELAVDGVVVCAGIGSRDLAAKLGDRVNIYPVKGYSITVPLDDARSQAAAPWVSLLDDEAKIVTSRLGLDRFRIAGTAEFNGENRDIRDDRIQPLINWCRQYFPAVQTEHVVAWAGLRPMMPNMMPRIGRGSHPAVFYNTGHGHLGWTLSAITAEMVGDVVVDGCPSEPHTEVVLQQAS
ncbi:MAG: D-amino acid dehydrogenase [Pseudomonadota bacterium]